MNNDARAQVQAQFELFVKSFNTNDEYAMWRCFAWPYTDIQGTDITLRYRPIAPLAEVKSSTNWYFGQIASLEIRASDDTAHVLVQLVRLDSFKQSIGDISTLYIYKKIAGEWKIFLISNT